MYQQWTATVYIFLKVPTTDSLVFLSEHISRTAILTQASVITCKYSFRVFFYWFYMFSFYYFIFQRLIWNVISVYFLWFYYWIIKEWKAAKVENLSVEIVVCRDTNYLHKWLVQFLTFTGAMFIFSAVKFLNMCKPRPGWSTSIGILWKWASKPTELPGDGDAGWFGSIRS